MILWIVPFWGLPVTAGRFCEVVAVCLMPVSILMVVLKFVNSLTELPLKWKLDSKRIFGICTS